MFLTFSICLFLDSEGNSQETRFGRDWPTVKECLEFTEETGLWFNHTETIGDYTLKFDANGEFAIAWIQKTATTNRFQRDKNVETQFVRKGKWHVEYRLPSGEEKFHLTGSADGPRLNTHFLVLEFVGNEEANRTEYEKSSTGKINGMFTLALYEFPAKPGAEVSSPKTLVWFFANWSPDFDSEMYRPSKVTAPRRVNIGGAKGFAGGVAIKERWTHN